MSLKIFKNLKYSNGFTLAEVLITLVIIGIIAAMTIPTLMKNTKKQEFVTGLKKADSVLSQALISMAKNNDASPGDYSFLNRDNFIDELAKVLNVVKKCDNFEQCFGKPVSGANSYRYLNNTQVSMGNDKSLITTDGFMYSGGTNTSNDTKISHGLSEEDRNNAVCRLFVDVNGQKPPNQFGYDMFIFYVVNGKGIVPAGSNSTSNCYANGSGTTCAAKVLKENAMNY